MYLWFTHDIKILEIVTCSDGKLSSVQCILRPKCKILHGLFLAVWKPSWKMLVCLFLRIHMPKSLHCHLIEVNEPD